MNRLVVLSDMQIGYHHKRAVHTVQEFVADYAPDGLLCVGDEIDAPEPARWSKGMAMEYAGTLEKGIDETRQVMAGFRQALGPGKPFRVSRSNHADRLEVYIRKYAPAFSSLGILKIESLLGYEESDIEYLRQITEVAPGWVMAHGDEGPMRQYGGGTALALAKQVGKSVVCGHTHRSGVIPETTGYAGKIRTLYGFEVGHLMDMRKASYLKRGAANWQMSFGILYVEGSHVTPSLIPVAADGSFVVEGKRYGR